jgi:hypothetical protein
LPLKKGFPTTSETNHQPTQRKVPEQRRRHVHGGGSLKSRKACHVTFPSQIQSVLQHLRLVTPDATCERCLKLSPSYSRWRFHSFAPFLPLLLIGSFGSLSCPTANSATLTRSIENGVCFLRLPQHPDPGRTQSSSPVTTPSHCPVPPAISSRLLKQSSINKLQFTFPHDHTATQWGETIQYKVLQTICVSGDKRNNKQRKTVKTNKFQYATSVTRMKEITREVTRKKWRFVETAFWSQLF